MRKQKLDLSQQGLLLEHIQASMYIKLRPIKFNPKKKNRKEWDENNKKYKESDLDLMPNGKLTEAWEKEKSKFCKRIREMIEREVNSY